jgi:hypothetical protein
MAQQPQQIFRQEGVTLAFVAPFGLFKIYGLRRKSLLLRGGLMMVVVALVSLRATDCSGKAQMTPTAPGTPANVQFTINATSGTIIHSVPGTLINQ